MEIFEHPYCDFLGQDQQVRLLVGALLVLGVQEPVNLGVAVLVVGLQVILVTQEIRQAVLCKYSIRVKNVRDIKQVVCTSGVGF